MEDHFWCCTTTRGWTRGWRISPILRHRPPTYISRPPRASQFFLASQFHASGDEVLRRFCRRRRSTCGRRTRLKLLSVACFARLFRPSAAEHVRHVFPGEQSKGVSVGMTTERGVHGSGGISSILLNIAPIDLLASDCDLLEGIDELQVLFIGPRVFWHR